MTDTRPLSEVSLTIDGQNFYRGNVSQTWIARNTRPDGSIGGLAEKIPDIYWPILERVAELEARCAELQALRSRADARIAELSTAFDAALNRAAEYQDKAARLDALLPLAREAEKWIRGAGYTVYAETLVERMWAVLDDEQWRKRGT